MADLQRYDTDQFELFIDQQTGEAWASTSGLARMLGIAESTLRGYAVSRKISLKMAEVPTPGGLQGSRLWDEKQIFKAAIKYNPALAEAMGEAGARVCLHTLAGYEVSSSATQGSLHPEAKQRVDNHEYLVTAEEMGGWIVVDQMRRDLHHLAKAGLLDPGTCPEISVGRAWSDHRKSLGWGEPMAKGFPAYGSYGQLIPRGVTLYAPDELSEFYRWYHYTYKQTKGLEYLATKLSKDQMAQAKQTKGLGGWFQNLLG